MLASRIYDADMEYKMFVCKHNKLWHDCGAVLSILFEGHGAGIQLNTLKFEYWVIESPV